MLRHLGCMSTVYHSSVSPKAASCPWLSCVIFAGQILSHALFFLLHQCQWNIKAYRECRLSNLLSVCVCVRMCVTWLWKCVFTLWCCSFLRVRDFFRSRGFTELRVCLFFCWLFFLAVAFVLLLTGKIVLHFITTTTTSKQFPLNLYSCVYTSTPSQTQMHAQQHKNPGRTEKIKSPEKINHYISLVL